MSENKIELNISNKFENIDNNTQKKMIFIFNALNDGWTIKKCDNSYIFTQKHLGKKEVFQDDYLNKFISDCFNLDKIFQ